MCSMKLITSYSSVFWEECVRATITSHPCLACDNLHRAFGLHIYVLTGHISLDNSACLECVLLYFLIRMLPKVCLISLYALRYWHSPIAAPIVTRYKLQRCSDYGDCVAMAIETCHLKNWGTRISCPVAASECEPSRDGATLCSRTPIRASGTHIGGG